MGGDRVRTRDVRNECECECECQSECEKRPLAKPDHNFFDMRSFFNRKKTLESWRRALSGPFVRSLRHLDAGKLWSSFHSPHFSHSLCHSYSHSVGTSLLHSSPITWPRRLRQELLITSPRCIHFPIGKKRWKADSQGSPTLLEFWKTDATWKSSEQIFL